MARNGRRETPVRELANTRVQNSSSAQFIRSEQTLTLAVRGYFDTRLFQLLFFLSKTTNTAVSEPIIITLR